MNKLPKTYGFSLIELIIVVGLIAILTSIAVPTYINKIREQELKTSAQELLTDIRRTSVKSQTSIEGVSWMIQVDAESNEYFVYKCPATAELVATLSLSSDNTIFKNAANIHFAKNSSEISTDLCGSLDVTTPTSGKITVQLKHSSLTDKCININISESGIISYDETNAIVSCI